MRAAFHFSLFLPRKHSFLGTSRQTQGLAELNWQDDFQIPPYEKSPTRSHRPFSHPLSDLKHDSFYLEFFEEGKKPPPRTPYTLIYASS